MASNNEYEQKRLFEKRKRVWYYLQKPHEHEISCSKCNGSNLAWSEFQGYVWCYDCKIDFCNYHSVLSGPTPIALAVMMGISVDRYDMTRNKINHFDLRKGEHIEMTLEEYKQIKTK